MASSHPLPEYVSFDARPYAYSFPLKHAALLIIDMQRDFLLPQGFEAIQGGDLSMVQASIEPTKKLLDVFFHTREGHEPGLSDLPSSKIVRQAAARENKRRVLVIGDAGPLGRVLSRGEWCHDIIDELAPLPGEVIIDKPGKGSFWNTDIMHKLKARGVTHIIVAGGIEEATAGYNYDMKCSSLAQLYWSQGLFGFVSNLQPLMDALEPYCPRVIGSSTPTSTPPTWNGDLRIPSLQAAYRSGISPVAVIEALYESIEAYAAIDEGVWIHLIAKDIAIKAAEALVAKFPDRGALPPLFGEFTHCGNVLDLCIVAVPAGDYLRAELTGKKEDTGRLSFGISFLGASRMDAETLELARRFEESRTV
ncbi:hypothetical protein FKW77_000259 [Venturia effusa]|uniref:Isochorismatase-like domain-containing protein n=1 Tax=Venturia effusa TaxID=50376 RepID=A0A517LHW1_9PEZI|nr:hypothetical protein FKW77_000259 [Venturia effusa]